jgi:hypothetical protein
VDGVMDAGLSPETVQMMNIRFHGFQNIDTGLITVTASLTLQHLGGVYNGELQQLLPL